MAYKQYASVSEMLHDTAPEFAEEFDRHLAERALVKELLILRTMKKLDQLGIVRQTHLVLTEVSELENGKDADARLGDLQAYACAVGCNLEVRLVPKAGVDDQGGKA